MRTATKSLEHIRPHYTDSNKYLFHVLVNATSIVEANIALDLLHKNVNVPARVLTTTVNLREVLKSLPPSPFTMAVDETTLMRISGMKKELAVLRKETRDGYQVVVTTAGNLVLDLIIKQNGEKFFWTPVPITSDFVNPSLIPHLIESDYLLQDVIDLVQAMGIVFNPTLYISVEDWHLEYARETMDGLGDLF